MSDLNLRTVSLPLYAGDDYAGIAISNRRQPGMTVYLFPMGKIEVETVEELIDVLRGIGVTSFLVGMERVELERHANNPCQL